MGYTGSKLDYMNFTLTEGNQTTETCSPNQLQLFPNLFSFLTQFLV